MAQKAKMLLSETLESYPVSVIRLDGQTTNRRSTLILKDYILVKNAIFQKNGSYYDCISKTSFLEDEVTYNNITYKPNKIACEGASILPCWYPIGTDNNFITVYQYNPSITEHHFLIRCYDIVNGQIKVLNTIVIDSTKSTTDTDIGLIPYIALDKVIFYTGEYVKVYKLSSTGLVLDKNLQVPQYSSQNSFNLNYVTILATPDCSKMWIKAANSYYYSYNGTGTYLTSETASSVPILDIINSPIHNYVQQFCYNGVIYIASYNNGLYTLDNNGTFTKLNETNYSISSLSNISRFVNAGDAYVWDLQTASAIKLPVSYQALGEEVILSKNTTIGSTGIVQLPYHRSFTSDTISFGNDNANKITYIVPQGKKIYITSILFTAVQENYDFINTVSLYADNVIVSKYEFGSIAQITYPNCPLSFEQGTEIVFRMDKLLTDVNITVFGIEEDIE